MTRRTAISCGVALCLAAAGGCGDAPRGPLPDITPNDNTTAAGVLRGDTLRLTLTTRRAVWRPEGDSGPSVEVVAFSEAGRAPQIPAPLIRVREGTVIDLTVDNTLDSALMIFGLRTRPDSVHDSLVVAARTSAHTVFAAGAPGSYAYWAAPGTYDEERETLVGAFIVDPAGGSPPDRVFVMNIWGESLDSLVYRNALAINGRSWPATERIALAVGDTLRWRVINGTVRNHPMHLHGFFFTLDSRGDLFADTAYAPARRPTVVTERMLPGASMVMTTVPDRPGNWLFHCHIGFHVIPEGARLSSDSAEAAHATMSPDAGRHMAGLVLGITIAPRPGAAAEVRRDPRRLDLYVDEGVRQRRAPRSLGYVLQRGAAPPAPDSIEPVGSVLLLTRGQPTDIVVHNRLPEATAVHWHGIELESYSDGVVGWSGVAGRVAPLIAPGDSFTARLTLPRAGTFIYHTHLGDLEQLTSGLYGAIIVTEPGRPFDPSRDHLYVMGWDGPDDPPFILVNGTRSGGTLTVEAGRPQRLRFVGIGVAGGRGVSLRRGGTPAEWRVVAKDGWTLPAGQVVSGPATQRLSAGETFDVEFVPAPGEYLLTAMFSDTRPAWHQRIVAR